MSTNQFSSNPRFSGYNTQQQRPTTTEGAKRASNGQSMGKYASNFQGTMKGMPGNPIPQNFGKKQAQSNPGLTNSTKVSRVLAGKSSSGIGASMQMRQLQGQSLSGAISNQ